MIQDYNEYLTKKKELEDQGLVLHSVVAADDESFQEWHSMGYEVFFVDVVFAKKSPDVMPDSADERWKKTQSVVVSYAALMGDEWMECVDWDTGPVAPKYRFKWIEHMKLRLEGNVDGLPV